ncbi:MAG: hypothetical protein IT563_04125 [Alphaproteobacteria bacterium]|nr:hypothetical protein [Alphaproteobacteria bacterium]
MQQTVYAELLDRCVAADFDAAFSEDGAFIPKDIRGRRYWYFQEAGTKKQRYAGPENAELLERIFQHRQSRSSERERRSLVSTLVRSASLPRPLPAVGNALAAMATAGVFRLRAVLVGTVAYQTYSASLGVRLPRGAMETLDVDIAQDRNVSVAVKDAVSGMLDTLRAADPTFRAVPPKPGAEGVWSYKTGQGDIRVEFLTPNRGPDSDALVHLPALDSYALQLRFLDYLIRDPQPAVVLHGPGILVNVPAPERYALHKLIVARRRAATSGKANKDLEQAQSLLSVLVTARPHELLEAWGEARGRGMKWHNLMLEGLGMIDRKVRDATLKALGRPRSDVPGLTIDLTSIKPSYHPASDTLKVDAVSGRDRIVCVIEGLALTRLSGRAVDPIRNRLAAMQDRIEVFERHFKLIEAALRKKYLHEAVDSAEIIRLTVTDLVNDGKKQPR